ncbi:MAG: EAL domain-containing protein [Nostocaceae cyanobacterium]|nr:EAL domain-containing protein [Nostocaceae cyanobacterium]
MNLDQVEQQDILIIDDSPDNLRVLAAMLTNQGYNVRKALNWHMALTACQTVLPNLILLDIMMPDVDGYEVCQRLKASEENRQIPVIFLSALDDVFDKVKAFNAGGVDYITKPFQFEEVLVRVKNQLALQAAQVKILKLNSELEQRVKKHTLQLESANQELVQEITERQELQNKLLHLALHDPLTGLPNRSLFLERLQQYLNKSLAFAVFFLDCDRFKLVNDSLGHLVGDELLVAIAHRLKTSLRDIDTLARLGGDEFAIILDRVADVDMATQVAANILNVLTVPFRLSRYEVFINVSIGIAFSSPYYKKPEYLLRDADTAMYRAKALGKARYHLFDPTMHQEAMQLLHLENDLQRAVERGEFVVHYQPIVCLTTGRITGLEALVRWQHPTRGLVFPDDFIPVAEETGLITAININVLRQACAHLHQLHQDDSAYQHITINVNLSVRLLAQPKLIAQIDDILQETQLKSTSLKLEITESVLLEDTESAMILLQQFQERQIQLVIDDFGTGYSSLSYLHKFPLNVIKIDKSFVRRMHTHQENQGLVPAMIGIAHSIGMSAIAEGVETDSQLAQLKSLNCDFAQGYLFSEPLSSQSLLDLLNSNPKW